MTGSPPSEHTVFIDRNTGGKLLKQAVADADIPIVLHDDFYGPPKPGVIITDAEWLVTIGQRGWLIVTGDKHTVKEELFIRRIPESRAYVFLLNDLNGGGPAQKAQVIIDAYPKMLGLIAKKPRPAIWLFEKGAIRPILWEQRLERLLARDA